MTGNKIKLISIITNILFVILSYYFKSNYYMNNKTINDILVVSFFIMTFALLIYGTFLIDKLSDIPFVMLPSLLFCFLVRSIPNIRLSYPPLHDPYFYITSTLNIVDFATLTPKLLYWYPQSNVHLHWPTMHLLTSEIIILTGIDVIQIMRFFNPLMGCLFFLSVFILSYQITSNLKVSLIASLFASSADIPIFYQSEYHPQGFFIILFIFFLYFYFRSKQTKSIVNKAVTLLFVFSFITVHHFSSIFIVLFSLEYLIFISVAKIFLSHNILIQNYRNISENIKVENNLLVLIIVAGVAYHFFVYFNVFTSFVTSAISTPSSVPLITIGQSVPLYTTLLSTSKWVIFLLAFISILNIRNTKKTNELTLAIIFGCIFFAGILGNYVVNSPLDRIILFYIPIASIFAALTVNRVYCMHFSNNNIKLSVVLFIALILSAGILNSQSPSYFYKDSQIDTYYWYSNKLPLMDSYVASGIWLGNKTTSDAKYGVEFDTRIIPFFYAKKSLNSIYPLKEYSHIKANYILYNPKIPYKQNELLLDKNLLNSNSKIYDNAEIEIVSNDYNI